MWSQNIKKDAKFGHKWILIFFFQKYFSKFFINFQPFLLLCGLVSNVFTIFFMGSEVCLERCDSYGNFGYLEKKSNIFILGEFCKRTQCPSIETLALLFFLYHKYRILTQRKFKKKKQAGQGDGKNTVFLLSRKIYSEYFKKLNVSDNSESYLLVIWFTNFYSDFFLKSEFLPSQAPTNHPTILLDISCLADLKRIYCYLLLHTN